MNRSLLTILSINQQHQSARNNKTVVSMVSTPISHSIFCEQHNVRREFVEPLLKFSLRILQNFRGLTHPGVFTRGRRAHLAAN